MSATNSQNGATAKDVASGRFSDPLGLLNLFNRAFSSDETKLDCSGDDWEPNLACQINAEKDLSDLADSSMMAEGYLLSAEQSIVKKSDVMDKVKLHADEFKRNGLRRRWEHARTAVQKKRTQENTLIDSPPPLYKSVSTKKIDEIEPPLSGDTSRPKAMPHRPLDATLRPPNEPEALGQVPKWLKHSPNLMAPYNRPQIERTKTVYKYGDVIESKLPTMKHDMASQQDEELHFDSRFESGNLLSSTRLYRADVAKESTYGAARLPIDCPWVVDYEYNLQMHPDLRTSGNTQWFYFEISNVKPGVRYRFNITNFAKNDSLYLEGMQPLMYSTKAAKSAGIGWRRAGTVLCYSRNPTDVHRQQLSDMLAAIGKSDHDVDDGESSASGSASDGSDEENVSPVGSHRNRRDHIFPRSECKKVKAETHTMTFDIEFEFDEDIVYLAYSHPYTYTELQNFLNTMMSNPATQHTTTRKVLCNTIAGNRCDLLTITAPPYVKSKSTDFSDQNHYEDDDDDDAQALSQRRLLVVSARVHPGETNSSWILQGMLEFLTSIHPAAVVLRKNFVFKIVPMLNPDGVINGNYRCSLSGQDLNRQWHLPCHSEHPTVASLKNLIRAYQSRDESRVALFCDLHGHSRAQGLFLYGMLSDADKQGPKARSRMATFASERAVSPQAQRDKEVPDMPDYFENREVALLQGQPVRHQQIATAKQRIKKDGVTEDEDLEVQKTRARQRASFPAGDPRLFPIMLAKRTPGIFTKKKTTFKLGRGKSCTARAVVCRELGVRRSYTLEVSFCGGVSGAYQDSQFTTKDLKYMGRQWCLTLVDFFGLNEEVVTMVKLSKLAAERSIEVKERATAAAAISSSTPRSDLSENKSTLKDPKRAPSNAGVGSESLHTIDGRANATPVSAQTQKHADSASRRPIQKSKNRQASSRVKSKQATGHHTIANATNRSTSGAGDKKSAKDSLLLHSCPTHAQNLESKVQSGTEVSMIQIKSKVDTNSSECGTQRNSTCDSTTMLQGCEMDKSYDPAQNFSPVLEHAEDSNLDLNAPHAAKSSFEDTADVGESTKMHMAINSFTDITYSSQRVDVDGSRGVTGANGMPFEDAVSSIHVSASAETRFCNRKHEELSNSNGMSSSSCTVYRQSENFSSTHSLGTSADAPCSLKLASDPPLAAELPQIALKESVDATSAHESDVRQPELTPSRPSASKRPKKSSRGVGKRNIVK